MAGGESKPTSPEFLTAEKEGTLTVLKCRTPGEAFLVADELEAADILVVLPGEEDLEKEFESNGSVSIRVSSRSYDAAKELQTVIERKHWDDRVKERSDQPLSVPMILVAISLGMAFVPGCFFLWIINDIHKARGYGRKAKSFRRWFFVGIALLIVLVGTFSPHETRSR